MRYPAKSLICALLCLCICLSLAVPAFAAGESNNEGITFSAELDKTELTVSESAQTVTLTVTASKGMTLNGIGGTVVWNSPVQLQSIGNADDRIVLTAGDVNQDNGRFGWNTADTENIDNVTSVASVTFTVPANTPAGTYTVGLNGIELSRRANGTTTAFENRASATASFTITENTEGTDPVEPPVTAEGYSASLSTLSLTPTHEDGFAVNVKVSHKAAEGEAEQSVFAAGEMTITYDPETLTFVKADSTLPTADCITEPTAGTLKIADYGSDKRFENIHYVLAFTSRKAGSTAVALTRAAFTNKENAATSDLVAAALVNSLLELDIQKKVFTVTLPSEFQGNSTVVDGDNYTMTLIDGNHTISNVRAFYADGTEATVVNNGDGTYTIQNVTGSISRIEFTKMPNVYRVTFDDAAPKGEKLETATYGVDYSFTLPDDQDAYTSNGVRYTLKKITMNGVVFTDYSYDSASRTYTIQGDKITGDMVITIQGETVPLTHYTVTVEGQVSEIGENYEKFVAKNTPYTLAFKHLKGHTYIVTATMGGTDLGEIIPTLNTETGKYEYTIDKVTGNLVFHVVREFDYSGVTVEKYLTIDSKDVWIILKKTDLEENMKPLYDGKDMFWSDRYQAYCYLVIADNYDLLANVSKITLTTGSAPQLVYNMDINMSGKVDAADAQLVYNMYNAVYADFTTDVTMEKFLLADVNGSFENPGLDTNDAVAIISYILTSRDQTSAE